MTDSTSKAVKLTLVSILLAALPVAFVRAGGLISQSPSIVNGRGHEVGAPRSICCGVVSKRSFLPV